MVEPPTGTARSRQVVFALSLVALAAAIGGLGRAVAVGVSLSFLFVLPVALAAWYVGPVPALVLAAVCSFDWLLVGGAGPHALWSTVVELGFFTIIATTLWALRRSLEHQRSLATTDDLTGAPNRRAFYERAALEIERLRRHEPPLTLVFLDLDAFKEVNDRFGHRAGDDLLRGVAATLRRSLRAVDFVARLGGDEFAILLPATDEEAARTVLAKVRDELRELFAAGGWAVTSSAGAVTFAAPPASIDSALAEADALLYAVKAEGRNGVAHRSLDAGAPRGLVAPPEGAPHTRR